MFLLVGFGGGGLGFGVVGFWKLGLFGVFWGLGVVWSFRGFGVLEFCGFLRLWGSAVLGFWGSRFPVLRMSASSGTPKPPKP